MRSPSRGAKAPRSVVGSSEYARYEDDPPPRDASTWIPAPGTNPAFAGRSNLMPPVRIGVIGAGAIGRTHIETLLHEPAATLAGIADPSPSAAAYAAERGVRHVPDHRDLLEHCDAVVIATPRALHAPVGLDCAARGVHMLVEKPIAESVEAARRLTEAADRAGVALLVGHHRRHSPLIQAAREVVRGGRLGRLTAVTAIWTLRRPESYYAPAWRREPGGGPVLTNLIHDLDVLRFVCGEIESLQAVASSDARGLPLADTVALTLRFAGGALGTVTMSDAVAAPWAWDLTSGDNPTVFPQHPENCYFLAGTEASLTVPKLELWRYDGEPGWQRPLRREVLDVAHEDPYTRQLRHFVAVVRGDEEPVITGADATRTLAATVAVDEAARTGLPVALREEVQVR